MKTRGVAITAVLLFCAIFIVGSCEYDRPSIWEMKCAACHDGKTVLNGKVVMGQEEMQRRHKDMEAFVNICKGSPECMSILKHDKDLFREVGQEIGIGKPSR